MKKIFSSVSLIICALLFMNLQAVAASGEAMNWYCVRNKEHKQPRLDANMKFIENYDAYYVDKKHSDTSEEKVVYLTFDAGYENGNIEKILDIMKNENVNGAFFILSNLVDKAPELVCRMVNEGHTVANHTSNHKDMTKIEDIDSFRSELDALNNKFEEVTGKKMSNYYRPPEGRFDETSLAFAQKLGYKTIFWSFAYADWDNNKQPSEAEAKKKILDNIHNGAVILLHPTSATNAAVLDDVIRSLKAEGYRFGTLDELTAR